MKTKIFLMTVLIFIPLLVAAATLEVSQPVQVTNNTYYERGQSIVYDGTNYWLFYGRSASNQSNYGGVDPDLHDYVIYYKKAGSVADLAAASAIQVTGTHNNNLYMGETDAVNYDGKVWVFGAHDPDGQGTGSVTTVLYAWTTSDDGTSWTETQVVTGMPDGSAHFAATTCDNKLWLAYKIGGIWKSKNYDASAWSSEYDIQATYGTGKFFVEGTTLYFVRAQGGAQNLYQWNGTSWSSIDSATEAGAYDPTIIKVGTDYVWAYAPWVSPKQWINAKVGSSLSTLLSTGTPVEITSATYGTNVWCDMWPIGFTDNGGNPYLFFTSERNPADPANEITGNIWYLEVDWDVSNDHYTFIQNAIDAATANDVIEVAPGTYYEDYSATAALLVTKAITISGTGLPVVDGGGTHDRVIEIQADGVSITGMKFTNSSSMGMLLYGVGAGYTCDNALIENCEITNNNIGIQLNEAGNALIKDNTITGNTDRGIIMQQDSDNNLIQDNIINMSGTTTFSAIYIGSDSGGNTIGTDGHPNNITMPGSTTAEGGGTHLPMGIYISGVGASDNTIQYNNIDGCASMVQIDGNSGTTTVSHNIFGLTTAPSFRGVQINGGNLVMTDNTLYNTVRPIEFWAAGNVTITGNTLDGSDYDFINIGSFTGTLAPVQHNVFLNMGTRKIHNQTAAVVDATYNYWGDNDPSDNVQNSGGGSISYSPCWGDATGSYLIWFAEDDTELAATLAAAADGDEIHLAGGTYGPIIITKGVTISGETGTREATVFDGGGSGTVVQITDDNVVFENCTVQNSGPNADDAGIKIIDTGDLAIQNVTVQNNTVTDNANGIVCVYGTNNLIKNNSVTDNDYYGIALVAGSANTIETNTISGNGLDAIAIENGESAGGSVTDGSTGNFIKGNTISSARDGIFIGEYCYTNSITENNVIDNVVSIGIHVWRDGAQTITDNSISNAEVGIKLRGVSNGTVTGNTITSNATGIELEAYYLDTVWYPCTNNDISDNKIYGNTLGVKGDATNQTVVVDVEENWWGDPAGPTPPGGRTGDDVTTNVDYDPWWIDEGMTTLSEDVDIYVDAPDELIKDDETQTYSVKVAAIADLRGFEVDLQYPKAYFAAASNFSIGSAYSGYASTSLYPELITDDDYWKYKVTGSYLGAYDGIDGTDVVLFTFDMASLVDVENLPGGSVVDLTAAILKDDQNPYNEIPYDELIDFTVYIDSSEPTMTHDNATIYPSPYTLQTGVLPELDFTFTDNYNLDDVQYLVLPVGDAAPTAPTAFTNNYIVENFDGTLTPVTDWFFNQSELDALADGTYTIYYIVLDDAGNFTIYDWDFIKDTSAPDAATWVSCLTSIDANNSIDLEWTNPTDAAKNHIWYLDFASLGGSGYPEYVAATNPIPAAPDPTAASPQNGWTFIADITASTTYTWTGMARGYYYITVFAEDASGNLSAAPAAPFYRESISYWPGDVYDAPDGIVNSNDITTLSTAWGAVHGGTGWNNLVDVGPTVDNGRRSLPTPDDVIDIEDLMIFSMNYNNTNYTYYPRVDDEDITPIHIDMICYQQGELMSMDLVLNGNENLLKGVNVPVYYGSGYQLESVSTGEIWPEGAIMLHTNSNGIVEISLTALGSEAVVEGDGIIATLEFSEVGNSVPELRHMTARTPNNQEIEIINNPEATESDEEVIIPVNDILLANYPNPFNPSTTIAFGLKEEVEVSLVIFNIKGQLVNTLVEGVLPAGTYEYTWHGNDRNGHTVPSGVYFYKMQTADYVKVRKAILLK